MKKLLVFAAFAALASVAHADSTLNFHVNFSFSGLSGTAPYGLEVDLSDPQTAFGSSSVTLSNFVVNGATFTGASTLNGIATGNLGTFATLGANDTTALSYIFRDFGSSVTSLSFDVSATSDLSLASAHGLSFYIYDANDFLNSGGPSSKAYLTLDMNSAMNSDSIKTFTGSGVGASVSAVPEPSTYGLMGSGAAAAVAFVRRRRKLAGIKVAA